MSDKNTDEVIVIHPAVTGAPAEQWPRPERQVTTLMLDEAVVAEPHSPHPPARALEHHSVSERAMGLDVFRGLLMIGMVFSFTILGKAELPAWMYHMQFPPPGEQFTPIPGVTWRDLIFPGFIFALAAAIPLAYVKYLADNEPYPALIWRAFRRAAVLFAFAIIIGHTNPFWTNDYTKLGNVTALAGFLACWPLLLARRKDWNEQKFKTFKTIGLIAAAVMVLTIPLLYDRSFSLYRKDNVIHALAFIGLAGLPIWLFTRNNLPARVAIIAAVAAVKLAASAPGWLNGIWQKSSWVVEPWFIELLILAIPGTIAGEKILDWMRRSRADHPGSWSSARLTVLAVICALVTPVLLVGLYLRAIPATTVAVLSLVAAGWVTVQKAMTARDRILGDLFRWGGLFLALGILLEPFEGGIRKDPQTLSFLLLTAGFSFVSLVAIMIAADLSKRGRALLQPVSLLGRNPLLIYVMFSLCINHIAYLAGVGDLFTVGPVPALLRAVFFTSLTAAVVLFMTRRGLFWKA